VSYTIGYMALPQNEACLRHYLDTLMCTDERVIATNIRLKTSNDLSLVSRGRSIKCVLCDLYYVSLYYSRAPGWRLPLHTGSLAYCIQW
jgi:hypothetical protein